MNRFHCVMRRHHASIRERVSCSVPHTRLLAKPSEWARSHDKPNEVANMTDGRLSPNQRIKLSRTLMAYLDIAESLERIANDLQMVELERVVKSARLEACMALGRVRSRSEGCSPGPGPVRPERD